MTLSLKEPTEDMFDAFFEMAEDYRRASETRYQNPEGWTQDRFSAYLQQLRDQSAGKNLPPKKSPQTTYWLLQDEKTIVGVSRLRLELNDDLMNEGGNIGYDVPPSQRRLGFGTELLRQTIAKAKELGLKKYLITCNKDNIASRKVIEANGGIFASEGFSEKHKKPLLRFWIE